MSGDEDREIEAVDRGLSMLFARDQDVPPAFTVDVLRRIQEDRWRREAFLDRIFYAGLSAAGILVIIGAWFAMSALTASVQAAASGTAAGLVKALTNVSGDAAIEIAIAGMVLTGAATWRRLIGHA